jgi:hypothetical protein
MQFRRALRDQWAIEFIVIPRGAVKQRRGGVLRRGLMQLTRWDSCRLAGRTRRTAAALDHRDLTPTPRLALWGILGTKWEQDWQHQPNAATVSEDQGSIVTGLKLETLSIAATCFQYHVCGRRAGLKIRSSQEGVGSSLTFGTDCKMLNSVARSD